MRYMDVASLKSPTPKVTPLYATLIQGCIQMARGKCPNCKELLAELIVDTLITGKVHIGKSMRCINFLCSNCSTVVGSQVDPVSVKTDTVDLLLQKLRYAKQGFV
jgi:hypothetical protein